MNRFYLGWYRDGWYRDDGVYTLWFGYWVFQLKTPKARPYFSERYGYRKPTISFQGYRLFITRLRDNP